MCVHLSKRVLDVNKFTEHAEKHVTGRFSYYSKTKFQAKQLSSDR